MNNTLELINKEGKTCYILGDFNINLFKGENHSPTEVFLNNLYANYFYPTISKLPRVTNKSASLIDNILTNSIQNMSNSGLLYTDISDHFPIFQLAMFDGNKTKNKNHIENLMQVTNVNLKTCWRRYLLKRNMWSDANTAYKVFMKSFN